MVAALDSKSSPARGVGSSPSSGTESKNMIIRKNAIRVAVIVGLILLIPLFGNIFVDGWNWSIAGFFFVGALLFGTGLAIDLASRKITNPTYRVLAIISIVLALILVWIEIAVDAVSRALGLLFR